MRSRNYNAIYIKEPYYAATLQTNALCSEPWQHLRSARHAGSGGKHQPIIIGDILGDRQRDS